MTARVVTIAGMIGAQIHVFHGIVFEGALWLVVAWQPDMQQGMSRPMRMLRAHDPVATKCPPGARFDYVNFPLPKGALDYHAREVEEHEVRMFPDTPLIPTAEIQSLPSIFQKG
jgi:hypothetical protein